VIQETRLGLKAVLAGQLVDDFLPPRKMSFLREAIYINLADNSLGSYTYDPARKHVLGDRVLRDDHDFVETVSGLPHQQSHGGKFLKSFDHSAIHHCAKDTSIEKPKNKGIVSFRQHLYLVMGHQNQPFLTGVAPLETDKQTISMTTILFVQYQKIGR